ncbi:MULTISPECIES: TlyA family RNA methyltransferase [Holzapfeliella]
MKKRVDVILAEQGYFPSRQRAQSAIMAGNVLDHNHQRIDKAGDKFDESETFILKNHEAKYVSRGGFKLEKALKVFNISLQDKICLDIGASTGGFTDVALQNGAQKVYALDVGYNQLAWSLREDPRVVVMERQNFRYSTLADFNEGRPTFAMTDVSFISLKLILPPMYEILEANHDAVCLIKPQFEAGREKVGKKGIIKDHKVHAEVLDTIIDFSLKTGFDVLDLDFSPIKGGHGNIEFLIHLRKNESGSGQNKWNKSVPELMALVDEGI